MCWFESNSNPLSIPSGAPSVLEPVSQAAAKGVSIEDIPAPPLYKSTARTYALLDLGQKASGAEQPIEEHLIRGTKAAMAEYKKPPQEHARAGKQMVKNKSVSDLVCNLLLICLRENIKGQIHRRVSTGLSHLHSQTSTQMISSNLTLFSEGGTALTCRIHVPIDPCNFVLLILNEHLSRLNSVSINLQGG